jgi:hypothetical protein
MIQERARRSEAEAGCVCPVPGERPAPVVLWEIPRIWYPRACDRRRGVSSSPPYGRSAAALVCPFS